MDDSIKQAFQKVKEDIMFLVSELNSARSEILQTHADLVAFRSELQDLKNTQKPHKPLPPTHLEQMPTLPTHNQTQTIPDIVAYSCRAARVRVLVRDRTTNLFGTFTHTLLLKNNGSALGVDISAVEGALGSAAGSVSLAASLSSSTVLSLTATNNGANSSDISIILELSGRTSSSE